MGNSHTRLCFFCVSRFPVHVSFWVFQLQQGPMGCCIDDEDVPRTKKQDYFFMCLTACESFFHWVKGLSVTSSIASHVKHVTQTCPALALYIWYSLLMGADILILLKRSVSADERTIFLISPVTSRCSCTWSIVHRHFCRNAWRSTLHYYSTIKVHALWLVLWAGLMSEARDCAFWS